MNDPICIVEYDDPDVDRLRDTIQAKVLLLGLPSCRYSLDHRSSREWELGDGRSSITFDDLCGASYIWYRRWKTSPPVPAVTASPELGPEAGAFVERQWETTLATLFQTGYHANASRWSRAPCRRDNKISTNELLESLGLLPETYIALTAPSSEGGWVWKPLDSDQSVGKERAAVIAVTPADEGVKQPCPGFYQRRVPYSTELRVAYVFGKVAAVSQEPETDVDIVDKRYVDMIRLPFHSQELTEDAGRVARSSGLNMFTADVLVDNDGRFWWIDVNQDGLFSAADSPDGHLLSTVLTRFTRAGAAR